jgi:hypothetical protein
MRQLIEIIVVVPLLILYCTSGTPDISGTSEQGNARVVATIYNKDKTPAAGSNVTLRRADFIKTTTISEQNSRNIADTVTGPDGSFVIDSLDTGFYFIEINDKKSGAVLLPCTLGTYSAFSLGTDTLEPYAVIKGKIGQSATGQTRYIQVIGLERRIAVNNDGSFTIPDLPAGEYSICFTTNNTSFIRIPGITTKSSQTTLVPFNGWLFSKPVYLNTTSSGADITGTIYNFPVLIRLDNSNFVFSEAKQDGSDLKFVKNGPDSVSLPFDIVQWDGATKTAEIWVLFDTIVGNADKQACIMQWGNPNAVRNESSRPVFDTSNGFGGVWHLSSNVSVPDATPNRFTGVPSNIDRIDGMIGYASGFIIKNKSYITIENSAKSSLNFPANGYYTVSAWVNSDSTASNRVIVGKGDLQYYLRIHSLNWHFAEFHDTPSKGWEFTSSPYSFGKWVYVCGVRNGSSQYLYIDGICVDSSITLMGESDGITRTDTFNIDIGRKLLPDGSGSLHFSGGIDEVRICTSARSSEWIKLCYMNQQKNNRLVRFGN